MLFPAGSMERKALIREGMYWRGRPRAAKADLFVVRSL